MHIYAYIHVYIFIKSEHVFDVKPLFINVKELCWNLETRSLHVKYIYICIHVKRSIKKQRKEMKLNDICEKTLNLYIYMYVYVYTDIYNERTPQLEPQQELVIHVYISVYACMLFVYTSICISMYTYISLYI